MTSVEGRLKEERRTGVAERFGALVFPTDGLEQGNEFSPTVVLCSREG